MFVHVVVLVHNIVILVVKYIPDCFSCCFCCVFVFDVIDVVIDVVVVV